MSAGTCPLNSNCQLGNKCYGHLLHWLYIHCIWRRIQFKGANQWSSLKCIFYLKIGSVFWMFWPALQHQLVNISRTIVRLVENIWKWITFHQLIQILNHFFVCQLFIWLLPCISQYLPKSDSKGPNVTFCSIFALVKQYDNEYLIWIL